MFLGVNITKSSYALFSAKLKGEKTIEVEVDTLINKTTVFNYTGDFQEYEVPKDGYYYIELGGASGGYIDDIYNSGLGAKTSGYIYLEKGEVLYFYIGGKGTLTKTANTIISGGYNGGGDAKTESASGSTATTGGGATDIRLVNGEWDNTSSLISRIMVAAGGAGSNNNTTYIGYGGAGGTLHGLSGESNQGEYYGTGGTQISGGVNARGDNLLNGKFGIGGGYYGASTNAGSGGGGYYGGASGAGYRSGGGGGSSYISGYAGVNSVEESTTITHTNQTLHYSGKYFIGGKMVAGQNEGNGYAKITYVYDKPKKKTEKLDNVRYVRNCISYNSYANSNAWPELQAIKDGVNIAKGKIVTGNTIQSSSYPYSRITDGDINYEIYARPASYGTNQCVTVDLGSTYDLDEVAVWNYFLNQRRYYDNITSVSSDNKNFTTVINEASIETSNGSRINAYTDTYNGYVQDNLMLWYDGYANTGGLRNNETTSWKDLSGNNNDGTLSGATWYYNSLSLDGVDDYVTTPYSSSLAPNEFTIDLTFERLSSDKIMILFVKWYGYTIELNADDTVVFGTRTTSDGYMSGGKLELNETYNVVATYKNNEEKIYINGELKNTRKVTGSFSHTLTDLTIGRFSSSNYSHVNLNQVKFYNKALTEEEILHNYSYDKEKFNLE